MVNSQKEEYIQLKEGYRVYTRREGEGEVKLLTLHGGPGLTHECFTNFPGNLNPEGVQVIFYDQLGSYFSDQPDDLSLWKMERFVDELHQVVQALGLENQFVLANSWGSMLLIDYLLKYKASFKGIILSGMPASFQKFKQNITLLRSQLPHEILKKLEEHEKKGTTANPEYQQLLLDHWFNKHYCLRKPWPEPLMQMFQHLAPSVLFSLLGANVFNFDGPAASWNRTSELNQLTTPCLLVAGKEDLMFEEDLKEMADRIPHARYFIAPGGHFCWWDNEKDFFKQLNQFIQEQK